MTPDPAALLLALRLGARTVAAAAREAGLHALAARLTDASDGDAITAALRAARTAGADVDAWLVLASDLDEALVAAAEEERAEAVAGALPTGEGERGHVDVVLAGRQDAGMSASKSAETWSARVEALVAAGEDRQLVELASGPSFAGTQEELARLSGLAEASISRGKSHGFSAETRAWFRAYLFDPAHPPAPLPHQPGRRARPGAAAPVAWVSRADHRSFEQTAKRCQVRPHVLMDWLMRRWIQEHAAALPEATTPRGPERIRTRLDVHTLVAFDDRIGGAARRGDYLREAVHEGLQALRGLRTLPEIAEPEAVSSRRGRVSDAA